MENELTEVIEINLSDALSRRYRIRRSGTGSGLEASLPREVIAREARRTGLDIDEFMEKYQIEWLYNDFAGLHARFVPVERERDESQESS